MELTDRLARRLQDLRSAQGLSLDALAARSGVSRSAISLIERGQSSPTATVLDRLSAALGVTLASLFEQPAGDGAGAAAPSPLSRRADQPVWTDPGSGYRRRNLSPDGVPALPAPLQLVEVDFPPGARVAYETGPRPAVVHQQVWLIAGCMELTVGSTTWRLQPGDCLAMQLDQPTFFHNPGDQPARYLVALVTGPGLAAGLATDRRSPP